MSNPPPPKVSKKHLFQKGQSGNPAGSKPMPPHIREALKGVADKGVERLKALVDDDTAWGSTGWLDGKTQIKVAEVAIHRAYGAALLDPRATKIASDEDGPALLGHVLRQAYEALREEGGIPEYIKARRADLYVDVTPPSTDATSDRQLTQADDPAAIGTTGHNDVPKIDRAEGQRPETSVRSRTKRP